LSELIVGNFKQKIGPMIVDLESSHPDAANQRVTN
jgi:hypothetical protein